MKGGLASKIGHSDGLLAIWCCGHSELDFGPKTFLDYIESVDLVGYRLWI